MKHKASRLRQTRSNLTPIIWG